MTYTMSFDYDIYFDYSGLYGEKESISTGPELKNDDFAEVIERIQNKYGYEKITITKVVFQGKKVNICH